MICGEVITLPSLLKEFATSGVSSALDGTDFRQPSPRAMLPAPPSPAMFNAAPLAAVEVVGDIICLALRRQRCRRLPTVTKVAFERPSRNATLPLSQKVEEIHRFDRLCATLDAASMLMQSALNSKIHAGWPLVEGLDAS
jgi:hypothetical protein